MSTRTACSFFCINLLYSFARICGRIISACFIVGNGLDRSAHKRIPLSFSSEMPPPFRQGRLTLRVIYLRREQAPALQFKIEIIKPTVGNGIDRSVFKDNPSFAFGEIHLPQREGFFGTVWGDYFSKKYPALPNSPSLKPGSDMTGVGKTCPTDSRSPDP